MVLLEQRDSQALLKPCLFIYLAYHIHGKRHFGRSIEDHQMVTRSIEFTHYAYQRYLPILKCSSHQKYGIKGVIHLAMANVPLVSCVSLSHQKAKRPAHDPLQPAHPKPKITKKKKVISTSNESSLIALLLLNLLPRHPRYLISYLGQNRHSDPSCPPCSP